MRLAPAVREALRLFWDKDVKRVSPGALGMTLQGYPLDERNGRAVL